MGLADARFRNSRPRRNRSKPGRYSGQPLLEIVERDRSKMLTKKYVPEVLNDIAATMLRQAKFESKSRRKRHVSRSTKT